MDIAGSDRPALRHPQPMPHSGADAESRDVAMLATIAFLHVSCARWLGSSNATRAKVQMAGHLAQPQRNQSTACACKSIAGDANDVAISRNAAGIRPITDRLTLTKNQHIRSAGAFPPRAVPQKSSGSAPPAAEL